MTVRPAKTDQPRHPPSQWVAQDQSFLHADSEDSDQTGRMTRLIRVFAGRTCRFVGFVMRRLIYAQPLKWSVMQLSLVLVRYIVN